ncbi:TOBE domain-containing protein [Mesorhizobium sp. ZMM04-4]
MSALNVLPGRIAALGTGTGPFADVTIDCNGQEIAARITRQSAATLGLTLGMAVFAVVKSVTFDRRNTARTAAGASLPRGTTSNPLVS